MGASKRTKSEPESFAKRLYKLLHRPSLAKEQYRSEKGGAVVCGYHKAYRINYRDFERHMSGEITLAVSCVKSMDAIFMAWDIDDRFDERLPIFAAVMDVHGYSQAAFALTGSEPGRGKIVLTLDDKIPKPQAIRIATALLLEAQRDTRFGHEPVTVYPNHGRAAGNTVRLFGKNLRRAQSLIETPLDLSGAPSDLYYLVPAKIPAEKGTIYSRDMKVLFSEAVDGNGATIAGTALKAAWASSSLQEFEEWCNDLCAHPGVSSGVREQLGREDFRARTWSKRTNSVSGTRKTRIGCWRPIPVPPKGLRVKVRRGALISHYAISFRGQVVIHIAFPLPTASWPTTQVMRSKHRVEALWLTPRRRDYLFVSIEVRERLVGSRRLSRLLVMENRYKTLTTQR